MPVWYYQRNHSLSEVHARNPDQQMSSEATRYFFPSLLWLPRCDVRVRQAIGWLGLVWTLGWLDGWLLRNGPALLLGRWVAMPEGNGILASVFLQPRTRVDIISPRISLHRLRSFTTWKLDLKHQINTPKTKVVDTTTTASVTIVIKTKVD